MRRGIPGAERRVGDTPRDPKGQLHHYMVINMLNICRLPILLFLLLSPLTESLPMRYYPTSHDREPLIRQSILPNHTPVTIRYAKEPWSYHGSICVSYRSQSAYTIPADPNRERAMNCGRSSTGTRGKHKSSVCLKLRM